MIKRFSWLITLLVIVVLVAACTGAATPVPEQKPAEEKPAATEAAAPAATEEVAAPAATEEAAAPATGAHKYGQVTDVGGIDDKSFNQLAWAGMQQAGKELGVDVQYLESQQQTDYEKNINEFVQQKYDGIITVGFLLADATKAASEANPDIPFIIVDSASQAPGTVGILSAIAEPSFLAGYLAAGMSETGTVCTYGGIKIPPVVEFMVGFEHGVKYYNEQKGADIKVLGWKTDPAAEGGGDGSFTGNFESLDDGRSFAENFFDEGCDIILPVAGPVGLGSAAAAQDRGFKVIGVDADQTQTAPEFKDVFLTSILKKIDVGIVEQIKQVENGAFAGGTNFILTLANKGLGLAPFHEFEDAVPQELRDELTAVEQGIVDGSIKTGWPVAAPEAAAAPAETKALKVGLVTDVGEVDDKSFNQSAWEGAQSGAAAIGGEADYIETQDAKDYLDNIAEFADADYDVIITVGFALGPATIEAAQKWPEVKFIGVDQFQGEAVPNLVGLVFHEDQSGYLAGVLAANLSQSNTIAAVLGTDLVPPVVAFKEGYEAGAKSVKPDIKVISTYHPGGLDVAFTDPEWGATTSAQAIDQGADVVFGAGGKTGNGALIETAGHEGVYCIGVDTDQWETVPEAHPCLVSSAMKMIVPGVEELINLAAQDKFPSGNYFGGAGLAPFHDFEAKVPAEVKTQLEEIAAGLKDGSIKTGYGEAAAEEEAAAPVAAPAAGELGSAEKPINVLFVPSVDAGVIVTGGDVMAKALNEATGLTFKVDVPTSYAATVEAMCASPEDTIGFIPALGYVLANNNCGVEVGAAAVRRGLSWYTTQFLVQRDSGIKDVKDLAGKKWAVPDLGSTSGYLYPQVMLKDAGVEPGEIVEAGGHPQAVLAVYNGDVDFATSYFSPPSMEPKWQYGDNPEPFEPADVTRDAEGNCLAGEIRVLDARCAAAETAPDVFEKVGILSLSQQIPNDTMSFSPDFPEATRQVIIDAMVKFAASEQCKESICNEDFYGWSGIDPVDDSFYDPVRQLITILGYTEEDIFK